MNSINSNIYSPDNCYHCGQNPQYNEPSLEQTREAFSSKNNTPNIFYHHSQKKKECADKFLSKSEQKQWKLIRKKLPTDENSSRYNRFKSTVVGTIDRGWEYDWDPDFITKRRVIVPIVKYEQIPPKKEDFLNLEKISKLDRIANNRMWISFRASEIISTPEISEKILSYTFHFPVEKLATLRLVNSLFRDYIDGEIFPNKGHEIVFYKSRMGTTYKQFIRQNWPKEVATLSLKVGISATAIFLAASFKLPIPKIISFVGKSVFCSTGPGLSFLDAYVEEDGDKDSRITYESYIQQDSISKKFKFQKYITPNYQPWKVENCLKNLSPPEGLEDQEQIRQIEDAMCPISQEVMMFPAKDSHGHSFDYHRIRRWITEEGTCPLNRQPLYMHDITFDVEKFYQIHQIIRTVISNSVGDKND